MPKIELLPGSNEAFSRGSSRRRLVNWYPSVNPDTNKMEFYPMPGYDVFTTTNGSTWKGSIEFNGIGYVVVGTELKEILPSGSVNTVGTGIIGGQERISFAKGKTQIMLVDGNQGYVYTPSTATFVTISDGNFPSNPTTCSHSDGYFLVDDPSNNDRVYRSQQNDATDWTIGAIAQFFTAERKGDKLKKLIEVGDKQWLIGTEGAEAWWNASDPDIVFNRVNSISVDWGIEAPATALEIDNNLIYLAQNERGKGRVLLVGPSGQSKAISPDWLESILQNYSVRTDAFADIFDYKGSTFYVLTFPTEDATWIWELNTQAWFEWKNLALGRHRNNGFLLLGDKQLIGDFSNGNIYQLKDSVYTDNGTSIQHLYRTEHIGPDNISLRWNFIEPVFEKGLGLSGEGAGSNPLCQLRWSKNQGNKWSDQELIEMGKIGEYDRRTIFRNKGWTKTMTLELSCTEPVKTVLTALYADVTSSEKMMAF